jgi:hypothetical protein
MTWLPPPGPSSGTACLAIRNMPETLTAMTWSKVRAEGRLDGPVAPHADAVDERGDLAAGPTSHAGHEPPNLIGVGGASARAVHVTACSLKLRLG